MIGHLQGTVFHRDPAGKVILDVQGVGYELTVSLQTLAEIPGLGERCALWIHTHVREDQLNLFGFGSERERTLFRQLTSVPKVGPRHAISVLGGFPARELVDSIADGDHPKLTRIPGIGKKTAEQITLTLGERMATLRAAMGRPEGVPSPPAEQEGDLGANAESAAEVLLALGWKSKPVRKALVSVEQELPEADVDTMVRAALARLVAR